MSLRRLDPPQRSTRCGEKSSGQLVQVLGLFGLLFLSVLLMYQFQMSGYRASSGYLEDALAAGGLAAAVVDLKEYSVNQNLMIASPQDAFFLYQSALRENLGLDENDMCQGHSAIVGKVIVKDFIVYNVTGGKVTAYKRQADGSFVMTTGRTGELTAPNGQVIYHTGIFGRITYSLQGLWGQVVRADKSKLVEVKNIYE